MPTHPLRIQPLATKPVLALGMAISLGIFLLPAVGKLMTGNYLYIAILVLGIPALIGILFHFRGFVWLTVGLLQGGMSILVFSVHTLGIATIPDGVTLPGFAVLAMVGVLFVIARRPTSLRMLLSPMALVVFGFSLVVVAGTFYTWHNAAELKMLRYITASVIPFSAALFLDHRQRQYLYRLLVVVAIAMALGVMFNFLVGGQGAMRGRYGTFGIDTITSSRMIGLGIVILLFWHWRRLRAPLVLVLGIGSLLAASRGPLVALAMAVALQPFFMGKAIIRFTIQRSTILLVSILAVALIALLIGASVFRPAVLAEHWGPLRLIEDTSADDRNITGRFRLWSIALDDFRESPLIGMGTAGYTGSTPNPDPDGGMYPHNIFLEVLAEWGLVGVTLFAMMLLRFIFNARALLRSARAMPTNWWHTETVTLTGLFTFTLIAACFSSELFNNRTLWLVLGLSEALRFEVKRSLHGAGTKLPIRTTSSEFALNR